MSLFPSTILNPGDWASPANARIDLKETPTAYVFVADLPGLNKEQAKVELVDNRVLQISGERKDDDDDGGGGDGDVENNKWHCKERWSGAFLRRFRLPEDANVELVKAKLEHGVLTVTVPKVERQRLKASDKAKAVEISVSGEGGRKKLPERKKKMLCCGLGV